MLNTEVGYRRLFFVAALYNLALGFVFLVFFNPLMLLFEMPIPPRESAAFHQMAIVLAMVFGFGYYMVSRNLYGNRGIVVLGIIGKALVFLLFLYHFIRSGLHFLVFLIGVGDLVFAALFCKFMAFARNRTGADRYKQDQQ